MMKDKNDKFKLLLQEGCPEPLHELDFHERVLQRIEHQKRLAPQRQKRTWKQRGMDFIQSPLPVMLLVLGLVLYFQDKLQHFLFTLFPQLEEYTWVLLPLFGISCMVALMCYLKELQQD